MKVMLFNLVLTPQHSTISFKVQKHTVLSAMEYLRPFQLILIAWLLAPPSTKYQVSLLIFVK